MAESSIEKPAPRPSRTRRLPRVLTRIEARWSIENANLVAITAVVLAALGQLAEDVADSEPLQLLEPGSAVRRWTVIVAVLYLVAVSRAVDRYVERSLDDLEDMLAIGERRFGRYARQLRGLRLLLDALLLNGAAAVVVILFVVLNSSLPIDDPVTSLPMALPRTTLGSIAVLAGYTVVGWSVVSLAASTILRAFTLGRLSREKLDVDVFDTSNLLSFGNIALAIALAPAGLIVILLIGFGRPSSLLSLSVLLVATLASVLALILPLRGVHRQMADRKAVVLGDLNGRIREVYERQSSITALDDAEVARLSNRTATLIALRKTADEMTTWPFRDTLAFGRALLIATAPLIYTVASELIKVLFINPLVK